MANRGSVYLPLSPGATKAQRWKLFAGWGPPYWAMLALKSQGRTMWSWGLDVGKRQSRKGKGLELHKAPRASFMRGLWAGYLRAALYFFPWDSGIKPCKHMCSAVEISHTYPVEKSPHQSCCMRNSFPFFLGICYSFNQVHKQNLQLPQETIHVKVFGTSLLVCNMPKWLNESGPGWITCEEPFGFLYTN